MSASTTLFAGAVRQPVWWMKPGSGGLTKPEGWNSALEAGREIGLEDIPYELRRVYADLPTADGRSKKTVIPNRLAICRGPLPQTMALTHNVDPEQQAQDWVTLDIVSDQYHLLPPMTVLSRLDGVSNREKLGDQAWPVNTLGLLNGGRRMFAALEIGEDCLFNADTERGIWYLFAHNDMTGGGCLSVTATYVQVVCANTAAMALSSNFGVIKIPHTSDAEDLLEFAVELHRKAAESRDGQTQLMDQLAKTAVDEQEVASIINEVYPAPERVRVETKLAGGDIELAERASAAISDAAFDRMAEKAKLAEYTWNATERRAFANRQFAFDLYQQYCDTRFGAGTLYGVMGAVGEAIERRKGRGDVAEALLIGGNTRNREMQRLGKALRSRMK